MGDGETQGEEGDEESAEGPKWPSAWPMNWKGELGWEGKAVKRDAAVLEDGEGGTAAWGEAEWTFWLLLLTICNRRKTSVVLNWNCIQSKNFYLCIWKRVYHIVHSLTFLLEALRFFAFICICTKSTSFLQITQKSTKAAPFVSPTLSSPDRMKDMGSELNDNANQEWKDEWIMDGCVSGCIQG